MHNVWDLLAGAVNPDPTQPLLTFYDDATGERTELSGATLTNWVSKTANLLVDGCGLGAGDRAEVLLPVHWQAAAVLLGCWSAGLSVTTGGAASPAGGAQGGAAPPPADVAFVAADRTDRVSATERYVLGLHPFGLPLPAVPAGYADYSIEVRAYGDRFVPPGPASDQGELCARAAARAEEWAIAAGERVLVDAGAHPDPVDWLLAPLAARATLVLCAHLDRDRLRARTEAERVDRVL